jgi:KipI family sensor histidine kinase inhibitor
MLVYPAGDTALCVEFGSEISPRLNDEVHALAQNLRADPIAGVTDFVPAYASLLVCFDPMRVSYRRLTAILRARAAKTRGTGESSGTEIRIPVCYEGDFAPDMQAVCEHTGFSREEVVARHTNPLYRIYMLGFLPGFPYLGGLDPALETPRLKTPRTKIPAGSVGIGGAQTGIYPLESPGGWQLIGRTPVRPYDPDRPDPFLYRAGDTIRFYAIRANEFRKTAGELP